MTKRISDNTVRRLPKYLRKLEELSASGIERISSAELARAFGYTPSQIRHDLCSFGSFGTQGYGYNVDSLRQAILLQLGVDRAYPAVLVGAGKIGRALLDNLDFAACGFRIMAAFDIRCGAPERTQEGIPLFPATELYGFISGYGVEAAVLCVPGAVARRTARSLATWGVKAIWNFTNEDLELPPTVSVENLHFSDSLLTLSYRLNERRLGERLRPAAGESREF